MSSVTGQKKRLHSNLKELATTAEEDFSIAKLNT